jgi:hypothetical protein
MQTLNDRVKFYCDSHEKDPPYGHHLNLIGTVVSETLRRNDLYVGIQKVPGTFQAMVNSYPDSLVSYVDEIITEYFEDKKSFWVRIRNCNKTGSKKFNYDVGTHKAAAFEEALKKLGIAIEKNEGLGSKKDIVQFILPAIGHVELIKLGKEFQKIWHIQKRTEYLKKVHEEQIG